MRRRKTAKRCFGCWGCARKREIFAREGQHPRSRKRQQSACYALCAPSLGLGLPVTPPDANSPSSGIGFA